MERNIKNEIARPPSSYDAYLYEWTVNENGKKYLGYHTGSVDDDYDQSSEDKEFQQIFDDPSYSFTFKVMEYGTTPEMRNREHQELTRVNAASNPMYYNKTNGSPVKDCELGDTKRVQELYDDIITGAFPIVERPIEYHTEMEFNQVRDSNDSEHQDRIRDRVNDGGIGKCDPIIVFAEFLPGKKDLRVDGNHTTWGISRSKVKDKSKIKTIIVPPDRTEGLTASEVDLLGLMLNRQEMLYKNTSREDAIQYLRRAVKRGLDVRSSQNKLHLELCNVSTHDINAAMRIVSKEVKTSTLKSTANWIDWTSDPYVGKLKRKIIEYTTAETACMKMSSGAFRLGKLLEELKSSDKKKMLVLLYHPDESNKKKWEKNNETHIRETIEYSVNPELTIDIHVIPNKLDDSRMVDYK